MSLERTISIRQTPHCVEEQGEEKVEGDLRQIPLLLKRLETRRGRPSQGRIRRGIAQTARKRARVPRDELKTISKDILVTGGNGLVRSSLHPAPFGRHDKIDVG